RDTNVMAPRAAVPSAGSKSPSDAPIQVGHAPCRKEAMAMRRTHVRFPLALALLIAVSGACGGGEDDVPPEYETKPGPNVPQPPAQRSLVAEGEVTITDAGGNVESAALLTKVTASSSAYFGRESG